MISCKDLDNIYSIMKSKGYIPFTSEFMIYDKGGFNWKSDPCRRMYLISLSNITISINNNSINIGHVTK